MIIYCGLARWCEEKTRRGPSMTRLGDVLLVADEVALLAPARRGAPLAPDAAALLALVNPRAAARPALGGKCWWKFPRRGAARLALNHVVGVVVDAVVVRGFHLARLLLLLGPLVIIIFDPAGGCGGGGSPAGGGRGQGAGLEVERADVTREGSDDVLLGLLSLERHVVVLFFVIGVRGTRGGGSGKERREERGEKIEEEREARSVSRRTYYYYCGVAAAERGRRDGGGEGDKSNMKKERRAFPSIIARANVVVVR